MTNIILEKYIHRVLRESVERKYKLPTIMTKAIKIIVMNLKKSLAADVFVDSRFRITKNEIVGLTEFDDLYIVVKVILSKKSINRGDVVLVDGKYYEREGRIILELRIDTDRFELEMLPGYVQHIKATLRHELEHAIQFLKRGIDFDVERKMNYYDRLHEIDAYAADLHYTFMHRTHRENSFNKVLDIWIEQLSDSFLDDAEMNSFKKELRDYCFKRYPLLKNQ